MTKPIPSSLIKFLKTVKAGQTTNKNKNKQSLQSPIDPWWRNEEWQTKEADNNQIKRCKMFYQNIKGKIKQKWIKNHDNA